MTSSPVVSSGGGGPVEGGRGEPVPFMQRPWQQRVQWWGEESDCIGVDGLRDLAEFWQVAFDLAADELDYAYRVEPPTHFWLKQNPLDEERYDRCSHSDPDAEPFTCSTVVEI